MRKFCAMFLFCFQTTKLCPLLVAFVLKIEGFIGYRTIEVHKKWLSCEFCFFCDVNFTWMVSKAWNVLITGINTFDETPPEEWFQMNAVLRVSLGNFLFFATFAVTMIGVKDQNDRRVPNVVVTVYGKLFISYIAKFICIAMLIIFMLSPLFCWCVCICP